MIEDSQQLLKYIRIFIGLLLIIVAVVFIAWLYHVFSLAKVTIKTNSSAGYVAITPIKNGQPDNPKFKRAQHELTLKVAPGSYEISASYNSYSVSRVITVKPRQSLSFSLTPIVAVSPEPVYGNSVSGVVEDGSRITFLDSTNNNMLSTIDSSNMVTKLYPANSLYDAKWVNASLGLAHDSSNNLYIINNGLVSPVNLSLSVPQSNANMSYDITASGQIYVSEGTSIYKGTVDGNFKKIYTSKGVVFDLSAGRGNVSAIESSSKNTQDPEGSLIVVGDSRQVRRTKINGMAVTQSPDGKYLVVESDAGLAIYAGSSLSQVASLPSSSTNSYGWGLNDVLFYNQGESLWIYDISSGQSNKLAIAPGKANILGIYPAPDGSYVYLSTASSNPNAASGASQLFRVGLKDQASHDAILGLSVFLPESLSGGVSGSCQINYVNFSAPTITINYPGSFLEAAQSGCLSLAQDELQQYGLSPGDYQYKFFPDSQ